MSEHFSLATLVRLVSYFLLAPPLLNPAYATADFLWLASVLSALAVLLWRLDRHFVIH